MKTMKVHVVKDRENPVYIKDEGHG